MDDAQHGGWWDSSLPVQSRNCQSPVCIQHISHSLDVTLRATRLPPGCSLQVHKCHSPLTEGVMPRLCAREGQCVLTEDHGKSCSGLGVTPTQLDAKMNVNPLHELGINVFDSLHCQNCCKVAFSMKDIDCRSTSIDPTLSSSDHLLIASIDQGHLVMIQSTCN